MKLNNFFDEWADNKRLFNVFAFIGAASILLLCNWTSNTFPQLKAIADTFFGFMVIAIVVGMSDYFFEKNRLVGTVYTGISWKNMWQSFLIGGILAFVLYNIGFSLSFASTNTIEMSKLTAFVFIVLVAPYSEEIFFRATTTPCFYLWFNNILGYKNKFYHGVLTTVLVSSIFAFYHYSILGLSTSLIIPFLFGIIATIGNYWRKSAFFGIGLHMTLNLIWFLQFYGVYGL